MRLLLFFGGGGRGVMNIFTVQFGTPLASRQRSFPFMHLCISFKAELLQRRNPPLSSLTLQPEENDWGKTET